MKKYALVTEDTPGVWEVFYVIRQPIDVTEEPPFIARLEQAYSDGYEIVGMSAGTQKSLVAAGAIWDGSTFSGGQSTIDRTQVQYEDLDVYAFLANNVVVLTQIIKKGSIDSQLFSAAFGNSVKMIKIEYNQVVTSGYTWDGTNFNPPA
jgi:hypothetical protein